MENFNKSPVYIEDGFPTEVNIEEVLKDTKERVSGILEQLRSKILRGEFGMVLGIDASGRVPALLIGGVIKQVSPATVGIRFVVGAKSVIGSYGLSKQAKNIFSDSEFAKLKEENKKVLIVEDTMVTGKSLGYLCKALRKEKIDYEVATLSLIGLYSDRENKKRLRRHTLGKNITMYEGIGSPYTADIYGKRKMSGVYKTGNKIHSAPLRKSDEYNASSDEYSMNDGEVLRYTRKRIKEIADELVDELDFKKDS